ncbi:hypothetical protein Slala03_27230 [Streptomyces lavendulae subsp. lavendulae]|uniref:hypothetical protein n=1 Tax=Streptomyces lavendulae TaxID=1914 RepID=UPI0024A5C6B3|nr:hypothetical protein [Streptomyces lavendulae]GLV83034.1 hypothetical protein Slala03_27230 [Streptomyces lavendulae subsp. lavendulae]
MSGDTVNMYGGQDNKGIVHHHAAPPARSPEQAVRELLALLAELRAHVPAESARYIDSALPAITADPAAVAPEERHRALLAVAGIAATVGAVGVPVVEAVRALLALLGA